LDSDFSQNSVLLLTQFKEFTNLSSECYESVVDSVGFPYVFKPANTLLDCCNYSVKAFIVVKGTLALIMGKANLSKKI